MAGIKRKLARTVGDMLNVHVIPKAEGDHWGEERFGRAMFAALRPDCVFDVGANEGQYARSLREAGYDGTILSFEPSPETFARLQAASAHDPKWHALDFALGDVEGVLPFNIMAWSDLSSFRKPAPDEKAYSDVNVVQQVIDVPVKTLAGVYDGLASQHGFSRPFLKMDTQGYDLEVVKGAREVIARFCGMVSEVASRRIYADSPHMTQSLATFADAGFELIGLYPVHPESVLNPLEFNCYVVRADLAV